MAVCVKLSLSLGPSLRAVALQAEEDVNLQTVVTARGHTSSAQFQQIHVSDGPVSESPAGCPYVVWIGNWESISEAKADEGPPVDRPSIFISIGGGVVARSGDSLLVPLAHRPTVLRRWPDIAKSFGWKSYEYLLNNADVEDIYNAWEDLSNKQSPVAIVNTLPPQELPFLLKNYPPEFAGSQIWIHVYNKQLCSRPFAPGQASSTESLYPDLQPLDASLWPLYEEYGLLPASQWGNITNLHLMSCPTVSSEFKERVRDIVQPNSTRVSGLVDTYQAALVYDAILLSSALPLQVPGFTLPGSGNGEEAVSAASKAVRDAALNALYNVSVPGVSGVISFESYTDSVQVLDFHLLSQPVGDAVPVSTCIISIVLIAYLHLDDTRPHVTPVPGSEVIVWPDNTVFPPDIPSVIALNRPTGEINPGIRPDGNDDSRNMVSRSLVAAMAVVGALVLCASVACIVWWCCCRSRRNRGGGMATVDSVKVSPSDRELSIDPLAFSGTPLTALSRSGNFAGGEDDGLVGVNYVRAKYHDSTGLPDDDINSDRGLLWNNVMSWMCGNKPSSNTGQTQSHRSSRRSRLTGMCTEPQSSLDGDDTTRWGASRRQNSTATRPSRRNSLTAEISAKPKRPQSSVTGSGHMALQGAPVQGESATMVITDIQSSARLTNCMPSEMSADHERHDRLLRHLMLLYNGIEVATEGDSFHVVFRLAADAVRWCVAVQMQLLLHDWSTSATGKCSEDVGMITVPEALADCPLPVAMRALSDRKCPQKPDCRVIFDGLRVRMGGHTDLVTHHRFDHDKNQHHYSGDLYDTTRAISESGSGGQIVFSQATIRAVQSLAHVSSSRYGDVVLMHEGRHYLTSPSPPERELSTHFRRLLCDQVALDESTTVYNTSTHLTQHSGVVPVVRDQTSAAGATGAVNVCMSAKTSGMLSGVSVPIGEGFMSASGISMSGSVTEGSFQTQAAEVLQTALKFSPKHGSGASAFSAEKSQLSASKCAPAASMQQQVSCSHTPRCVRSFQNAQLNAADCQSQQATHGGGFSMHGRHAPSQYVQLNASLWGSNRTGGARGVSGPVGEGAVELSALPATPISPSVTAQHISATDVGDLQLTASDAAVIASLRSNLLSSSSAHMQHSDACDDPAVRSSGRRHGAGAAAHLDVPQASARAAAQPALRKSRRGGGHMQATSAAVDRVSEVHHAANPISHNHHWEYSAAGSSGAAKRHAIYMDSPAEEIVDTGNCLKQARGTHGVHRNRMNARNTSESAGESDATLPSFEFDVNKVFMAQYVPAQHAAAQHTVPQRVQTRQLPKQHPMAAAHAPCSHARSHTSNLDRHNHAPQHAQQQSRLSSISIRSTSNSLDTPTPTTGTTPSPIKSPIVTHARSSSTHTVNEAVLSSNGSVPHIANVSHAINPAASTAAIPQARNTQVTTSTASSYGVGATHLSWSSTTSVTPGTVAYADSAGGGTAGATGTSTLTAPLAPCTARGSQHAAQHMGVGEAAPLGEGVAQQAQQGVVPLGHALGKLMGEKMEMQTRRLEQKRRVAKMEIQQERYISEADMTESSTFTSPFPSPKPPVVVRADGCASEHYPGPQPLTQRRTSDPSGQSIPPSAMPKRVQVHFPQGPNMIAMPSGMYRRPTRTTGGIDESSIADHTLLLQRNTSANSARTGGAATFSSGSTGALYRSASGTRQGTDLESPGVSHAVTNQAHTTPGDMPPRPAVSAPSGEAAAAALTAAAQRAVWEPWSRRMSGLTTAGQRLRHGHGHACLINDVASPSASSMSGRAAIVQELYTVLPECLKPRHEHFPPICTDLRITPAFANAPRDGDITICYTFITHMKDINAWSVVGAKAVVRMACALIRDTLVQYSGYEVRENSGNFLLSFGNPEDALRFCIAAQKAFMHHPWNDDLLKLPIACVHKDVCEGKELVFRGPRIHCGLSSGSFAEGLCTAIVPDARTGRAQYHGTLCNHAARVSSVAHGGQIVVSDRTVTACDHRLLQVNGVQLKDLGLFHMKGFGGEHRIWQVEDSELSRRVFPDGLPNQAGKVTPIPKPPGGMLSELRKRLRRTGAGTNSLVKPGSGDDTARRGSGGVELIVTPTTPNGSSPLGVDQTSGHSSITAQAIMMTSHSIQSGSADTDDAAVLAAEHHARSAGANAAGGNQRGASAAATAVGMLTGVSLFPSQRRPGKPRIGGRQEASASAGAANNSVFVSAPSASGPSASSDRGDRIGPLAVSFDSATVFSDETMWLSAGYNQQSSLLSDVRATLTPNGSGTMVGPFGGSMSGEEGDMTGMHVRTASRGEGKFLSTSAMLAAAPQVGYGLLGVIQDMYLVPCRVRSPNEAYTAVNAAVGGAPPSNPDPAFGSCVIPGDSGEQQFAATTYVSTGAPKAHPSAANSSRDITLDILGPNVNSTEESIGSSGRVGPVGVVPGSGGVSGAYESTPWPTSLTAPWLSAGRGGNGGSSNGPPTGLSQARKSQSDNVVHSSVVHGEFHGENEARQVSVNEEDEGGFSVTLNRAGSRAGSDCRVERTVSTGAHSTGGGGGGRGNSSKTDGGHSITAAPVDTVLDANARNDGESSPYSAGGSGTFPGAFNNDVSNDDMHGDDPSNPCGLTVEQSRHSVRSGRSGVSSTMSPMAMQTHSGNMEVVLGDFRPSKHNHKHPNHAGDLYPGDATSGETGGTYRDPGTPVTPGLEQGGDDTDDLNFVYNFDPHAEHSSYTGSGRDARTESVRASAGACEVCLDSMDAHVQQHAGALAAGAPAAAAARAWQSAARPHTEPASIGIAVAAAKAAVAGGAPQAHRPATLPHAAPQHAAVVPQVDLTPWLPIASESPRLPGVAAPGGAHDTSQGALLFDTAMEITSFPSSVAPQTLPMQMGGVDAFVTGAPTLSALQLALQFCDTAMELTDADGRLLHVNPAWVNLTGYAASEVLGSLISELIAESNGFFASTVLENGVPAPGVVTEGVEHMQCMNGGRMWHRVCRVTIPVEAAGASNPLAPCTLVILSRRLDMTAELADRYTIDW